MNQPNQTYFDGFQAAMEMPYYVARLMSPPEVVQATQRHPAPVRSFTKGKWSLCGDVSTTMYRAMESSEDKCFPTRLTCMTTPKGVDFAVISHQAGHFQHRFLLPLFDGSVQSFIAAQEREGLMFMLANDGSSESLLFANIVSKACFQRVAKRLHPFTTDEQRQATTEMGLVSDEVRQPNRIPSLLADFPVRDVSVSVVMPAVMSEVVDALYDRLFSNLH
ncbi:hypothetical protein [Rhodoferax saidenbachensis]|uniref:Uncharacterized protein n=1 Tax=Rhodoferax saidenbachensis TaxID=1484693 RepID=A0ABU1ZR94_9BURK|nr:hypothetical protein [Rhodoferax saidenbachensis]MDR7307923.1 hypothetical protein [Rhodoferax saidenbachensis]